MNLLGCLDTPTRGRYRLDGVDVRRLTEHQQAVVRNRKIPPPSAGPRPSPRSTGSGSPTGSRTCPRSCRRPAATSGHRPGDRDRASAPLADEPTGAPDSRSTADVLALFVRMRDGLVQSDVRRAPLSARPPRSEPAGMPA